MISYTLTCYFLATTNFLIKKLAENRKNLWWFGVWTVTDILAFAFAQWALLLTVGLVVVVLV